jgi:hypothetical protein
MPGFEMNWKVPEWSFDAEGLGGVEPSFESPSSMGDISDGPAKRTWNEIEKELVDIEDAIDKSNVEQQQVGESGWGWDGEPEEHVGVHDICDVNRNVQDDQAMLKGRRECEGRDVIDPMQLSTDYETEEDIKYPDPDLLPLPETINVLPSIFTETNNMPVISICTQPAVPDRNNSSDDSDVSSESSQSDAASPISLVQTPTPPASPPREAKVASLLKPAIANDLDNDRWIATTAISPMSENLGPVDVESIKDRFRASSVPLIRPEMNSLPTDGTHVSVAVNNGVDEDNSRFFDDQRFFCSPECTPQELPMDSHDGIEDEYTLNVECPTDDDCANDSHDCDETDTMTPLPYGLADGPVKSAEGKEEAVPYTEGRLQIGEGKRFGSRTGQEETIADTLEENRAHPVVDADEIPLESEMNAHPADNIPSGAIEIVPEEVAPSSVQTPASEQPHTSLPGTFPDTKRTLEADPVSKPQTLSPNLSVPPQTHRRRRSPLEEAIARTRSPLEVALAMQLRPGLGVGADPAWMVRFMMVMWGWMFGLVLVPGTEA